MTGTRRPFCAARLDVDPGTEARRIDLVCRGREEDVDACLLRECRVGRLVARIRREVRVIAELRGVHEERRDDEFVLRPRRLEERQVAVVQRTHRRDEPDLAAQLGVQPVDRADNLHVASASVPPARVS